MSTRVSGLILKACPHSISLLYKDVLALVWASHQVTCRLNDTRGGYATSQVRVFPDLKCTTLALLLYSHQ